YYHYYEYPSWHYVRRHYGVTDGRYKLIYFYEPEVDEWELYDLLNDRNEQSNLFDNPAYSLQRERLTKELTRLRTELGVPENDPTESMLSDPPERVRRPTGEQRHAVDFSQKHPA
ncbi:MAG: DUF4976 domain-containing protein, partial [Planctomycetales bacterium]|nr:DUF4976 domain-containing protein [Planctomycetales bacterium]